MLLNKVHYIAFGRFLWRGSVDFGVFSGSKDGILSDQWRVNVEYLEWYGMLHCQDSNHGWSASFPYSGWSKCVVSGSFNHIISAACKYCWVYAAKRLCPQRIWCRTDTTTYSLVIKRGNGKSPTNGGVSRKITWPIPMVHFPAHHVWLPGRSWGTRVNWVHVFPGAPGLEAKLSSLWRRKFYLHSLSWT